MCSPQGSRLEVAALACQGAVVTIATGSERWTFSRRQPQQAQEPRQEQGGGGSGTTSGESGASDSSSTWSLHVDVAEQKPAEPNTTVRVAGAQAPWFDADSFLFLSPYSCFK